MASIHAIRPIAQISPRMESQKTTIYFGDPDLDPVENQVNVWHTPSLVSVATHVRFEFETFCATLAACSVQ